MSDDAEVMALFDEVSAMEARLDSAVHRRGQRIADAITLAVAVPLLMVFGPTLDRPFLLFGLMVAALLLNRIPRTLAQRRLRAAHERLLREHAEAAASADASDGDASR